jgi:glycosyltransferase involved in cell wall biosynthesis
MSREFASKASRPNDPGLEVLFVQRRPSGAQVSIERLFDQVRATLGNGISWQIHVSPFASRGLLLRLRNLWAAWRAGRGRICHITGDVHYLALALPGKQMVLTIHDCAVLHRLRGWRRALVRLLWFEWPVRRAAVVTTISGATRNDLCQWLTPGLRDKVRVIPNCVREEYVPTPKDWDMESPVILQVGTGWNKNLERVAEALRGLSCRLWIVGPVDDRQRSILQSCGLDYECLGRLSDDEMVEAYRRCDAVVFASLFEGFGLPIVEAQATGRPLITSNRDPMAGVAGGGALLVDPEDVDSIREALQKLVADGELRCALVERGFENMRRYQPAAVAASYASVYHELAGMNPSTEPS